LSDYNDLVFEYGVVKSFAREAVELGLQSSALLLTERESALRLAIEKLKKKKTEND
jgi:hypothetical protein